MSGGQHSREITSMLTKSNSASQPQGRPPKNEIDHQQQQQQQQQEALASLFRSLSNLAHGSAQISSNRLLNMDNCPPTSSVNLTVRNPSTHESTPSSSSQSSIHPSLHGVVAAAAIMQQQLVTAAISQEQTMSALHTQPTSTNTNFYNQSSQLQANSPVPLLSEHISAGYPFGRHTATHNGLEHEVQFQSDDHNIRSQQHQQQQPQRINYCTICNKELCNKYFMKTHMLKMHGINLEVDQSASEEGVGQSHPSDNINQDSDREDLSLVESNDSTSRQARQSSTANSGQPSDTHKSKSSAPAASSNLAKSTTSVMNGFAGNSMGGVVCDICNKELCSKYFLKVHKQNTHGIMTDYHDANQFVFPFSNNMANPFMPPPIPISMSTNNMLPFPSNTCFNQATSSAINSSQSEFGPKPSGAKRARTTAHNKQSRNRTQLGADQHIDTVYRLISNQPQRPAAASGQLPFVAPPFDPVPANQINAMMCFGAMNPFGPTGVSPTMVVDMILRNQHLINRNKGINQQGVTPSQCSAGDSSKDKNNNDSKQVKSTSGKGAKESAANNSRYFTHYTEACPMCDRRFKSIKWLKTHMMNDHKQEIGAYMQMIMQSMYANKSQPPVQLAAQPYDQTSNFSSINFGHHNVPAPPTQQQQQAISYNAFQSQTTSILQTEQYSIVQQYLNQQRQMLQQQEQLQNQEMIDIKPELVYSDQTKLLSMTMAHHQSRDTSSSSSAGKTSPRSLITGLEFEDENQQLDLTMKFSLDTRPQSRKRSLELNDDEYLNDQDENSTRSSYNEAEQQKLTTDAIETNDLSRVKVKTTLDT